MSTTTIRLTPELKARVAKAAARAGVSSHSFILDAVVEKAESEERRNRLLDLAEQRYEGIVATGETISWKDMCAWLEKRIDNPGARKPRPRKLGR